MVKLDIDVRGLNKAAVKISAIKLTKLKMQHTLLQSLDSERPCLET